jgi:hypothetical protein
MKRRQSETKPTSERDTKQSETKRNKAKQNKVRVLYNKAKKQSKTITNINRKIKGDHYQRF